MENKKTNYWKILSIILMVCLLGVGILYVNKNNTKPESNEEVPQQEVEEPVYLSSWIDDADSKKKLVDYVNTVTDETSSDFIPVERRIAVFDLDGTLYCETDPVYFDHLLYMHRVQDDPNYEASEVEKQTAVKVQEFIDTGKEPDGLSVAHGQGIASSFAGMTLSEFNDYVNEYKKTPMNSYENMTLGEAFYQPMVEVFDYLRANGFTLYIVSGTDRLIVRGLCDGSPLNIDNAHIIGSDETLVSDHQEDVDGLNYVFKDGDKLVTGGEFIIKNLKMNKVSVIMQEIGMQPVLSFGNSTGDASMAEYTTYNNPYKSLAFMLCCDDTVRENGNESKAEKMFNLCSEFDWVPVSMKNDWSTIYKEGVVKK